MKPLAGITHQFSQTLLDIQVNIFQIEQPLKFAGGDLGLNLRHTTLDIVIVLRADDFLVCKHLGMGE